MPGVRSAAITASRSSRDLRASAGHCRRSSSRVHGRRRSDSTKRATRALGPHEPCCRSPTTIAHRSGRARGGVRARLGPGRAERQQGVDGGAAAVRRAPLAARCPRPCASGSSGWRAGASPATACIVITADRFRSQARNREDARERLVELIRAGGRRRRSRGARPGRRAPQGAPRRGQAPPLRRQVAAARAGSRTTDAARALNVPRRRACGSPRTGTTCAARWRR